MSGSSDEESSTPHEVKAGARRGLLKQRLPLKSMGQYEKVYENFMRWKSDHNAYSMSEDVFEAYFRELAKVKRSSTLWNFYSMIKCLVRLKHNVDIGNYKNLLSFLKSTSTGFTPTITKILTENDIQKFLKEAPEPQYLLMKVVLILGICGGCRNAQIRNLTLDDLKTFRDKIIVRLKRSNTKNSRKFVIEGELVKYVKKYQKMRPVGVQTNRFLLNIRYGKCVSQVVGVNRIAQYPKDIAKYLGLSNAESYMGSCFWRSSKTLWWLDTPYARASQHLRYLWRRVDAKKKEDSMEIETNRIRRSADEVYIEEDNVPLVTFKTLEKGVKLCNNNSLGHNAKTNIEGERFSERDNDESEKTKKIIRRSASLDEVNIEGEDNDPLLTSQTLENEAELCIKDSLGHIPKIKIKVERFSEGDNDECMGNESEKTKRSSNREAGKYFKRTMENNIEKAYEINPDTPAQFSTETPTGTLASSAKKLTQSVHQFNLHGKTIHVTFDNCKDCNVIFKVEK